MSGNSNTRRARNNLTSRVWDHFKLVQHRPSGSSEEACKAECKNCGHIMSFDPRHGTTTHLLRHIERNICRAAASARRRQQQEAEVVVVARAAANDDSQAAAEAFADGVWADGDDHA